MWNQYRQAGVHSSFRLRAVVAGVLLAAGLTWACTPESVIDAIIALANALDLGRGEVVTVAASDTTPPTVILRALYDCPGRQQPCVTVGTGTGDVSLNLPVGTVYWLEAIAEDPEGVRSVGVRYPCRTTSCVSDDLGSKQFCLSLDPNSDWPDDIISSATPGQQAHTREVWVQLLTKEPSQWSTGGRRCTRTPAVYQARATNFSKIQRLTDQLTP